jgi:uncharacterized protein (DUF305 family)
MNKKIWIYGAIGAVGSLAIAGFFTINSTFAQSDKSSHEIHHPGASAQTPIQSPSPSPGTGQMGQMMSGDIDQHFIVMMIPHHQGAVDMAELALTRAQRPEIRQLAEAIIRDQNREIEQMRTLYRDWYGAEVPDMMGMMGNQSRMSGSSGQGMMGMHSMMIGDLETLTNADDFDQEFIRQMIPHHQMAVMMAQMVLNTGSKPEIQELAQTIITTQTAEIEQMQQWNQEWYQ